MVVVARTKFEISDPAVKKAAPPVKKVSNVASAMTASNSDVPSVMTEEQKMLRGLLYDCNDGPLLELRARARRLQHEINVKDGVTGSVKESQALRELFPNLRSPDTAFVTPPVYVDYGHLVQAGRNFYLNFNCTILDGGGVEIGDNFMAAPGVQLLSATHPLDARRRCGGTATHPLDARRRCGGTTSVVNQSVNQSTSSHSSGTDDIHHGEIQNQGEIPISELSHATVPLEFARGIRIGDDVWIGAGAMVLPGVKIGDRAVVAAGAVVTRDVEPDALVAGNPARVLRKIDQSGDGGGGCPVY